jgi:glycosyltransferase involved in cell wall biosynthesis
MAKTPADEEKVLADKWPISVVVPARDAAWALPACLGAIAQNDLRNTELILVDDASSDDTASVARSFGFRSLRSELRLGPAGARNLGLGQSRFPHILFVDADVTLPASALVWIRETVDLYSHREDVAGVLGQYAQEIPWKDFFTQFKNLSTCYLYRMTETQSPFLHTAIFCVKRSVLQRVGGFDPTLRRAEDFRLGVSLGSRGYRFIIDRRIQGVHLKRYSFAEILREDWRRVEQLARVRLDPAERRFALSAHRWHRLLSVGLPGVILAGALAGLWWPPLWGLAAGLLLCFFLANLRFLWFALRRRGFWFVARAAAFLFAEMAWAELAVAVASLRGLGRRENARRGLTP